MIAQSGLQNGDLSYVANCFPVQKWTQQLPYDVV